MLHPFRTSLPALLALALAAGASAQTQTPPPTAPAPAPAATPAQTAPAPAAGTPAAQPGAASDPVLATVNNQPIQQSEVTNLLDQFMIPPGSEQRAYDSAMDLLVNTKLLAQFLEQQKIPVTAEEVQQVITQYEQNIKQQGGDLTTALTESGTTRPEFEERIEHSLQWQKFVTARATDAELKKYAEANKDVLSGTQVRASHILVAVEPDAPAEEKQKAVERLQAIKKEIESGQISFADAANKYSEDPGNKATPSGGDLDFFPRKGQFIEPFAAAAFGLQKGQISEPVETEYGFHLIQVTDRREGQPIDFEQAKPQILNQYAADLQEQIVDALRAKADIKIQPMPPGLVKTEVPPAPVQQPAPGGQPAPGTPPASGNQPAPAPAPSPAPATPPPASGTAPQR